jgi:hypothetical protein
VRRPLARLRSRGEPVHPPGEQALVEGGPDGVAHLEEQGLVIGSPGLVGEEGIDLVPLVGGPADVVPPPPALPDHAVEAGQEVGEGGHEDRTETAFRVMRFRPVAVSIGVSKVIVGFVFSHPRI